jgi:hypothetical protein
MTAHTIEALFGWELQRCAPFMRPENDRERTPGRSPVWRGRPTHSRTARNVSRAITDPRMGEALFGGGAYTPGPTHSRITRNAQRTITSARMGEAVFGGETYNAVPLHTFRERSRTLAWAKPCLAGRPTALVRTQPPETNTSRGRPSGMELPDYPVMATLPTPWDQDGPHFRFPPGLFPYSYLVTLPAGLLFPDS